MNIYIELSNLKKLIILRNKLNGLEECISPVPNDKGIYGEMSGIITAEAILSNKYFYMKTVTIFGQNMRMTTIYSNTQTKQDTSTTYVKGEINNKLSKVFVEDYKDVIGECSLSGEVSFEELKSNCLNGYNELIKTIDVSDSLVCLKSDGKPYVYDEKESVFSGPYELRSIFYYKNR